MMDKTPCLASSRPWCILEATRWSTIKGILEAEEYLLTVVRYFESFFGTVILVPAASGRKTHRGRDTSLVASL